MIVIFIIMILKNLCDCLVLDSQSQLQEITWMILKPLLFRIKHFAVHLLALLINYICGIRDLMLHFML